MLMCCTYRRSRLRHGRAGLLLGWACQWCVSQAEVRHPIKGFLLQMPRAADRQVQPAGRSPIYVLNSRQELLREGDTVSVHCVLNPRILFGAAYIPMFTSILCSRASQYRLTSPEAMPLTILASVSRLRSPRLPDPPSRGPSSLHSSASRFSSIFVSKRPEKRPYTQVRPCDCFDSGLPSTGRLEQCTKLHGHT